MFRMRPDRLCSPSGIEAALRFADFGFGEDRGSASISALCAGRSPTSRIRISRLRAMRASRRCSYSVNISRASRNRARARVANSQWAAPTWHRQFVVTSDRKISLVAIFFSSHSPRHHSPTTHDGSSQLQRDGARVRPPRPWEGGRGARPLQGPRVRHQVHDVHERRRAVRFRARDRGGWLRDDAHLRVLARGRGLRGVHREARRR
mmetsp:Transcript_1044/g.4054  ORF Transcript_1044/g.4054 Transcript_1044/m.4054 type:complete len:206 (-) Transcript_1044:724-1341(-)